MAPTPGSEAAIAFYRDVLGFEVRNDVGYEDTRWITVGPAGQPETSIVLSPPAVDPGITDDLDGAFAKFQAIDADIVEGPRSSPTARATARSATPLGT